MHATACACVAEARRLRSLGSRARGLDYFKGVVPWPFWDRGTCPSLKIMGKVTAFCCTKKLCRVTFVRACRRRVRRDPWLRRPGQRSASARRSLPQCAQVCRDFKHCQTRPNRAFKWSLNVAQLGRPHWDEKDASSQRASESHHRHAGARGSRCHRSGGGSQTTSY
eukprot:SAG11_NODE_1110_length_5824_cov_7.340087_6_plen_166_part_00